MPRLYGAPATARPARHREPLRPFDPDDLPLEAHRTPADLALLAQFGPLPLEAGDAEERSLLRRARLQFGAQANRP